MKRAVPVLLFLLAAAANARAERPTVRVHLAATAPLVDGRLDDAVWQQATFDDRFTRQFPQPSGPPNARTRFAVAVDRTHLYVAVTCDANDAPVTTRLTRRDRSGDFDFVEIILAPTDDGRNGYGFIVNPDGVQQDGVWTDDNVFDRSWDATFAAATSMGEDGWQVELAIPLHQIRFPEGRDAWGLQVKRWVAATHEESRFAARRSDEEGEVSRTGLLTGLEAVAPRLPLMLTPEVFTAWTQVDAGMDTTTQPGPRFGGGGYIKAGLAPQWVMDVALMPDFGEVEVDRAEVNLTNVETQREEKRPFFLENATIFSTPMQLFYSRRLGQAAPTPEEEEGRKVLDGPSHTPILGATRLTGYTRNGTYVGAVHALTMPVRYRVEEADGRRHLMETRPWVHAGVLRVGRQLGKGNDVGVMGTTSLREDAEAGAHAGAVDWNLHFKEKEYRLQGQVAGSAVPKDQGPGHETGGAALVRLERVGGEHFRGWVFYDVRSDGFDLNTLGYLDRDDLHNTELHLQYRQVEERHALVELYAGSKVHLQWNTDALPLKKAGVLYLSSKWRNRMWTHVGWYGDLAFFDDMEVVDGPPIRRPAGQGGWAGFSTAQDRRVGFTLNTSFGTDDRGHYAVATPAVAFRWERFEMELSTRFTRSTKRRSFVASVEEAGRTRHVTGLRDLMELDTSLKGTLVLWRAFTLQLTSQLLATAANYSDFQEVSGRGNLRPTDYAKQDADFATTTLRIQALARFEYRPGSVVYLSYTRNGVGSRDGSRRNLQTALATVDERAEQQVLLKLSHRFMW